MRKINYPLLYYQLSEEAVLGILVGTDYEVVERDLKSVVGILQDQIQRMYKKEDDYWLIDIVDPKLKVVDVKIRPTYRERTGAYPMSETLKIPVPVVFGETSQGHYECYLPLLDESFYYYDARQFRPLLQHFATDLLNRKSPEILHRHLMYGQPRLEVLTLRVNDDRDFNVTQSPADNRFPHLNRLAVRYPFTKAQQRNISPYPDAAWELEDYVAEVVDRLVNLRANLLVVGKPGVGKSAILRQAMRKISGQSRREGLQRSFWQVMSQRITASAKYLGQWQENVENLIEELQLANGTLWVVDIMRLLQTGGEGAEDSIAAFMISFLQQDKLQLIGEVTPQELDSMKRLLPGFVENFQLLHVDELKEDAVKSVLSKFAEYCRQNLRVDLEAEAIDHAYRLLLRYFPYENFPGKGINFLGRCVSEAQLNEQRKLSRRDIISNFVQQTGLPELFLRDDLKLDQEELSRHFYSAVIGQRAAVEQLCSLVKIFKAGLNNPGKPISTLLFAGPTGVGKTASAKALADYFFGKGQKKMPLIRIDMSEFQHPMQIHRFIGAGREVGKLVQEIRERPFAVLLLDEVEKAAPNIFDALLTVLDEGLLVDAFGRVTNFRNTIIIMTTNLGATSTQSIGFGQNGTDDKAYLSAINQFFRPEFVNRIDGIVLFNPLSAEHIEAITRKELEELKRREGFVKRGLQLRFTSALVDHLARVGFDAKYGARPLQRAIEQQLVSALANWLLLYPQVSDTQLGVDYRNGSVVVERPS
ncbi:MAG: AAA family ATPase [Bacteroidota bacterium]